MLKVTKVLKIHCTLCNYTVYKPEHEVPPKTCPACSDGKSISFKATQEGLERWARRSSELI